jgi:hypothetical protein
MRFEIRRFYLINVKIQDVVVYEAPRVEQQNAEVELALRRGWTTFNFQLISISLGQNTTIISIMNRLLVVRRSPEGINSISIEVADFFNNLLTDDQVRNQKIFTRWPSPPPSTDSCNFKINLNIIYIRYKYYKLYKY